MVCVAAVALGASTYAWFVTNNKVDATTSTISAQSNAAFMNIKYNATATNSDLTADKATLDNEKLYPAQWANNTFDAQGAPVISNDEFTTGTTYQFETAYGTNPTANGVEMVKTTLKKVGTPDEAVTAKYAVKNMFNISSKGTNLENLKVSGVEIVTEDKGNENLDNALRVLVKCGDAWVLCDKDGVLEDSNGLKRADDPNDTPADLGKFGNGVTVTAGQDTEVDMYVYYDGNDSAIYSNNLEALKADSSKITVSFTADPQNH